MPSRRALLSSAVALVLAAADASAQGTPLPLPPDARDEAVSAATALAFTPVAGLPYTADYMIARTSAVRRATRVSVRYGAIDRGDGFEQHGIAANLELDVYGVALELTGGYADLRCEDSDTGCEGMALTGIRAGRPVRSWSLDPLGTTAVVVGAEASGGLGFGRVVDSREQFDFDNDLRALGLSVAVPVSVQMQRGRVLVAPVLAPRLAYGSLRETVGDAVDTRSAARVQLGGTVMVRFARRLGLDVSIQRVFVDGAESLYGGTVSMSF